jgi:hypothetical protein
VSPNFASTEPLACRASTPDSKEIFFPAKSDSILPDFIYTLLFPIANIPEVVLIPIKEPTTPLVYPLSELIIC